MFRHFLHIALFVSVVLTSCQKNQLPPQEASGDPVFYFKATINGVQTSVEAGKDGYYMRSSHVQDTGGVYMYKAELENQNCTNNCGYGIAFVFNDSKVSALGESMEPEEGLYPGLHDFTDPNMKPLEYKGKFSSNMPTTTSFTWTYEQGESENAMSGEYVFKAGRNYNVRLDVNNFGCATTHSNSFRIGNPLQTNLSVLREQPLTIFKYKFNSMATGSVQSHFWDFCDGTTSAEIAPSHTYDNEGCRLVKLRLVSPVGDTCYSYYQLAATNANTCHANFSSTFTPVPNTRALKGVSIQVKDPGTGKIYTSASYDQSASNSFEVISVEEYQKNERGEKTKKVKIRFSCDLKADGVMMSVRNAEAVVAVSYH